MMSSKARGRSWWHLFRGFSAYALLPLVGLITAPLLARVLGPSGRGQLASVLQPLTVADAVLLAGVPTAVTYFIGRGHKFHDIRRSVITITSCTIVLIASIMFVYSAPIAEVTGINRSFILIMWLSSFLGLVIALRRAVLQGRGALGRLDAERALFAVLRLLCIVALVIWGVSTVEPYILAYLIPGLIAALILLGPISRNTPTNKFSAANISKPAPRIIYTYVVFAGTGHIANTLNSRLDQAVLPLSLTTSDLGMYSVAVTLAEVPLILSTVTTRNLLSEASKGVPARSLFNTALIGNSMVALTSGMLWAVAPWATHFLFGEAFRPASDVAQALLVGVLFASITASIGAVFAGTGHAGRSAIAPVLGVLFLVAGLIIFSQNMTAYKAAIIVMSARIACSAVALVVLYLTTRSPKGL
jgi:O-antigen/teichoic acid export membrane protein